MTITASFALFKLVPLLLQVAQRSISSRETAVLWQLLDYTKCFRVCNLRHQNKLELIVSSSFRLFPRYRLLLRQDTLLIMFHARQIYWR